MKCQAKQCSDLMVCPACDLSWGTNDPAPPACRQEGVKHDEHKVPMHLLPPELLEGTAAVLDFGARKYSARNWELGMAWHRPFSAMMRHMWAWWRGEDRDPETGMSHLWHAACCIAFLMAYEQRKIGTDDRPKENQDA